MCFGYTNMCHVVSWKHLAHVQHLYAYHFFPKYIAYFSKGKAIHPTLYNRKTMVSEWHVMVQMIYHEYERDIQPPSPIINFCLKNQLFDIAIYLYIWDRLKLLLNGLNELLIFFLDLHSSSRLAFVSIFKNNTPCRW